MLIDIHVYATDTDGQPYAAGDVLAAIAASPLDGLCIVGRDALPDPQPYLTAAALLDPAPRLFFGVELSTDRAKLLCIPPRLDLPILPAPSSPLPSVQAVLTHLNALAVAVVAVQPYEGQRQPTPGDNVFGFDGIHAVEIRTCSSSPLEVDLALESTRAMGLPAVAGTACMQKTLSVGRFATLLLDPVEEQADLAAALIAGECWAAEVGKPVPAQTEKPAAKRHHRHRRNGGPKPKPAQAP